MKGANLKMKKIANNRGITLIALIVTIIVLLILAGISISMLTGQNGILKRAAEAKGKSIDAQKEDEENQERKNKEERQKQKEKEQSEEKEVPKEKPFRPYQRSEPVFYRRPTNPKQADSKQKDNSSSMHPDK